MKNLLFKFDLRAIAAISLVGIGLGFSYLIPVAQTKHEVQQNFPAETCPSISIAGSNRVFLPATKLGVRGIDGKSTSFKVTPRSVVNLGQSALLVDSNPGTSITYSSLATSGIAATICSPGDPDQWFVGGSGGLTSKGILELVNSGLSESIMDIYPFTSKGAAPVISVKVKANSSAAIKLDAIAPGDDAIAIHDVTRTGRVSAFVYDLRSQGLKNLGGEYVKPSDAPHNKVAIVGIYPHNGGKSSVQNSLRLLAPGTLDATVHVEVLSADGGFVPVGFDGLTLKHGVVTNLPLTNLTTTAPFSLYIDSDQPILAGAFTAIGSKDFAWAAPAPQLARTLMNFGGTTPVFTFTGSAIDVDIAGKYVNGKRFSLTLRGSDVAYWSPKLGITSISFTPGNRSAIFGGALINSNGLTYLPIAQGASIENTALPFNDVHALTH